MRLILLAAFTILGISGAHSEEAPSRPQDITRLYTELSQADGRGDFGTAAQAAEECLAFAETVQARTGQRLATYSCAYYLSSALRSGRGVPRDPVRAFHLLTTMAAEDPNGRAALDLAEMYLDGEGTARDPVEAAVLVWRVEHGAWSIYSDYWGYCTLCEDNSVQEKSLHRYLYLTVDEQQRATAIEAARFPEIVERVKRREAQVWTAAAALFSVFSVFSVFVGLFWLWRLAARRRASSPT